MLRFLFNWLVGLHVAHIESNEICLYQSKVFLLKIDTIFPQFTAVIVLIKEIAIYGSACRKNCY